MSDMLCPETFPAAIGLKSLPKKKKLLFLCPFSDYKIMDSVTFFESP